MRDLAAFLVMIGLATAGWLTLVPLYILGAWLTMGLARTDCACGDINDEWRFVGTSLVVWVVGTIALLAAWWFVERHTRGPLINS